MGILRSPLFASISLLGISSLVSAGDICTYTSRGCIGGFGCCYNILPGTCCNYPAGYGWSIKFQNMPENPYWFGTTYGDTCSTSTGGAGSGDGNVCEIGSSHSSRSSQLILILILLLRLECIPRTKLLKRQIGDLESGHAG